jgi:hypothetical protein
LLPDAGLELVDSLSHVLSEIHRVDFWSSAVEACRRLIPKARVMTEDEADAWAAARRDSEAGVFFGSSNYYAYVARRQ